ncbi:MAG: type II toxin-antitoxin system VapC family toxin [Gammaproteobacteria bacterium]|nr:type II toxin-antitoxin system VapC family toxin [Gammaproteobacteria bacterium]MCY4269897.1 type II toxin-antitoxin system VapC family toxin [Gammaproteobacteria bacterium]
MVRAILDASALLAAIFDEAGAGQVASALREGAAMSAVNAAEVASRLFEEDWTAEEVASVFNQLGVDILPFDSRTAITSGGFRPATKRLGLGLGDRACLATALEHNCPALTADRIWIKIKHPELQIRCIR